VSLAEQAMRATILLSALAGVSAGALEGTSKNFDAEVINSGKNAFVKVRMHGRSPHVRGRGNECWRIALSDSSLRLGEATASR
jgi:hypothetical protein